MFAIKTVRKDLKMSKVLIGCTGSVATIKLPLLIEKLAGLCKDVEIRVVMTKHAQHFCRKKDVTGATVYTDEDEWFVWSNRGDPVLHIELAKWADVFVIAPLDANTLAKIAGGICDNLLTCTARAWDVSKPLLFCPAMNTRMLLHPITAKQIETLRSWKYCEVPCITKTLVCGDTGAGAMAEVSTIVECVEQFL